MKKILIITVYGSYNHGSFLQAYHLGNQLRNYGDPLYLDAHTRDWPLIITAMKRAKMFINLKKNPLKILRIIGFELSEAMKMKQAWKALHSTENSNMSDVVVLGSDEIWNISRTECQFPIFWGKGINKPKFSYAPSVNTALTEDFDRHPEYINYLKQVKKVSVRDERSRNILSHYATQDIQVVLDPTLLEKAKCFPYKYHKSYIAVYTFFGHITIDAQKEIVRFAHANGYDLIATGQNVEWCDRSVHSINGNPFYIFRDAVFVITSTFHGTAYAINHNSQFVAYVRGNTKVEELLETFDLSDRIAEPGSHIDDYYYKRIDYSKVNVILEERRKQSQRYIELNLNSEKDGI